jgi:Na+-translocating ferredoxin:NAD+ oxidoreductase RnfA subunit
VALLITEISVSVAMLVTMRGEILTRDVLRSVGASLGCAVVVVVIELAAISYIRYRYICTMRNKSFNRCASYSICTAGYDGSLTLESSH